MSRFVSAAATAWSPRDSVVIASPSCTMYGGASDSRGNTTSRQFPVPVHAHDHVPTELGVCRRTGLGDPNLSSTEGKYGAPSLSHNSRSPSLTTYGSENANWRLAYDVPSVEQVLPLVPENEGVTSRPFARSAWRGSCSLAADMKSAPETSLGRGDDCSIESSHHHNMKPGCGAPWQGADHPTRALASVPACDLLVANLQRISATPELT